MKHTVDTTEVESGWMALRGHDPNRRMVKATLIIGDERVFTETEVKAMVREMVEGVTAGEELTLETIVAKHGIVLDPA
jgi:hypothetical protein